MRRWNWRAGLHGRQGGQGYKRAEHVTVDRLVWQAGIVQGKLLIASLRGVKDGGGRASSKRVEAQSMSGAIVLLWQQLRIPQATGRCSMGLWRRGKSKLAYLLQANE